MKMKITISALMVTCGACMAQEVGKVISSTPVIQQVAVPHQVCSTDQVAVQGPKSGAGAVMGALAGGAMGNAVGKGSGQPAATMLGIVGGAILGDKIEGAPPSQIQNVQRCTTQTVYENRVAGYNVLYEFAGKQYSVQMPNDPGPTIQLQVTPAGSSTQSPSNAVSQGTVDCVQGANTGCVIAQGAVAATYPVYSQPIDVAPPPPIVEYPGPPPVVGFIWIAGFWNWVGGRHVWTPGHYEAPRRGYRWVPHAWVQDGGHWRQSGGRWEMNRGRR